MCRIAILPPGTNRKEAFSILGEMLGDNLDGTGEVFVRDGKFVVNKYQQSLEKVVRKGRPFLNHLPHNGFTLVHVRKASCGHICKENSHPFISLDGSIAVVHNGTLRGVKLLRSYLRNIPGYVSDTDSAVATELIASLGMKEFVSEIEWGGVFAALHLDGRVEIGKVSGQLAINRRNDGTFLLASELDSKKYKQIECINGYLLFNPDGTFEKSQVKKFNLQTFGDDIGTVSVPAYRTQAFSHVYTGHHGDYYGGD